MLAVPYSKIDFDTGQPDPEIVSSLRKRYVRKWKGNSFAVNLQNRKTALDALFFGGI